MLVQEQLADDQEDDARSFFGSLAGARCQEDRRQQDRAQASRRKEERLAIKAKARLSTSMANGYEGVVIDISANGCSFSGTGGLYGVGDQVWLRLDNMQPWRGSVRWIAQDRIGVEFINPFYPAVVEHLVETHRQRNDGSSA